MSAFLLSKSQGAIRTMSFSRIHILRLSFPLILHTRVWPSAHFTMTRSPPVSLSTLPRNSPCSGLTSSFRFASLSTFLLPIGDHQDALQWESAQPEDRFIATFSPICSMLILSLDPYPSEGSLMDGRALIPGRIYYSP